MKFVCQALRFSDATALRARKSFALRRNIVEKCSALRFANLEASLPSPYQLPALLPRESTHCEFKEDACWLAGRLLGLLASRVSSYFAKPLKQKFGGFGPAPPSIRRWRVIRIPTTFYPRLTKGYLQRLRSRGSVNTKFRDQAHQSAFRHPLHKGVIV